MSATKTKTGATALSWKQKTVKFGWYSLGIVAFALVAIIAIVVLGKYLSPKDSAGIAHTAASGDTSSAVQIIIAISLLAILIAFGKILGEISHGKLAFGAVMYTAVGFLYMGQEWRDNRIKGAQDLKRLVFSSGNTEKTVRTPPSTTTEQAPEDTVWQHVVLEGHATSAYVQVPHGKHLGVVPHVIWHCKDLYGDPMACADGLGSIAFENPRDSTIIVSWFAAKTKRSL